MRLNEIYNISSIDSEIKNIEHQFGVKIEVSPYPKAIHIDNIDRTSGVPGSGKAALQALCKFANENNLTLTLVAAEGHPKLIEYYLSLGFQINGVTKSQTNKWLIAHEKEWHEAHENDEDLEGVMMFKLPKK